MKSAPSLSFEPRLSRHARTLAFVIGVLAVGAVASSGMPYGPKIGLATGMAIATAMTLRTLSTAPTPRCTRLADGHWLVRLGATEHRVALNSSHDLGFVIALHFRSESGQRIDVALWPDSISPETRRQLRVWLARTGVSH